MTSTFFELHPFRPVFCDSNSDSKPLELKSNLHFFFVSHLKRRSPAGVLRLLQNRRYTLNDGNNWEVRISYELQIEIDRWISLRKYGRFTRWHKLEVRSLNRYSRWLLSVQIQVLATATKRFVSSRVWIASTPQRCWNVLYSRTVTEYEAVQVS